MVKYLYTIENIQHSYKISLNGLVAVSNEGNLMHSKSFSGVEQIQTNNVRIKGLIESYDSKNIICKGDISEDFLWNKFEQNIKHFEQDVIDVDDNSVYFRKRSDGRVQICKSNILEPKNVHCFDVKLPTQVFCFETYIIGFEDIFRTEIFIAVKDSMMRLENFKIPSQLMSFDDLNGDQLNNGISSIVQGIGNQLLISMASGMLILYDPITKEYHTIVNPHRKNKDKGGYGLDIGLMYDKYDRSVFSLINDLFIKVDLETYEVSQVVIDELKSRIKWSWKFQFSQESIYFINDENPFLGIFNKQKQEIVGQIDFNEIVEILNPTKLRDIEIGNNHIAILDFANRVHVFAI